KVVVLPHPDGPSSVRNSPCSMSKSSACTASTAPYRFDTLCRRTVATFSPAKTRSWDAFVSSLYLLYPGREVLNEQSSDSTDRSTGRDRSCWGRALPC